MLLNKLFAHHTNRRVSGAAMLTFIIAIATLLLNSCSTPLNDIDAGQRDARGQKWQSADIGGQGLGESIIAQGEVRLESMGDIKDYADAFHFTYLEAEGNVGIVARLFEHSATTPHIWPKAGLTIRGGLQPGDANVTIYAIDNDMWRGLVVQSRSARGDSTKVIGNIQGVAAPLWLRLTRDGDEVAADTSSDGESWERIASGLVHFSGGLYLGLAAASGNERSTVEAVYQDVQLVRSDGTNLGDPPTEPEPAPAPTPSPNPEPAPAPNPGPKSSTTYQVDSSSNFLNPERGLHSEVDLIAGTGFDDVRGRGYTLVRSYVRLDDFRSSSISSGFLNDLRSGLQRLRSSGIKVVLRFSYNFGNGPDAPLDIVLRHIDQLTPILNEYSDVIAVLQGGFIGKWGEWHSSQNGLTSSSNKKIIGEALVEALPDTRMIEVRAPFHRRDIVGSPSPDVEMFGTSAQARIGFVNDCFLSTDSDTGTYGGDQTRDRRETADFTRYTVTGGETCTIGYPSPRQDCTVALKELGEFHWDYLNAGFYANVLNRWRDQGCFGEIERRLGYRLALQTGAATSSVDAGGVLTVDLAMRNDGFGKVYNPRPIDIVLRNNATGEMRTVRAVSDARKMLPLAGEARSLQLSVIVPSDLPTGGYSILLALPDAASTLSTDVRYNIRLANVGTWEVGPGLNNLGLTTQVRN